MPRRLLISSRLEGVAFIRGRRLFEGGVYFYDPALRACSALIRSREINEHGTQPELGHGQSRRRLQRGVKLRDSWVSCVSERMGK